MQPLYIIIIQFLNPPPNYWCSYIFALLGIDDYFKIKFMSISYVVYFYLLFFNTYMFTTFKSFMITPNYVLKSFRVIYLAILYSY